MNWLQARGVILTILVVSSASLLGLLDSLKFGVNDVIFGTGIRVSMVLGIVLLLIAGGIWKRYI